MAAVDNHLITKEALLSLKNCLSKQFLVFQQKKKQSETTSPNLLKLSFELKSILLTHETALNTIVENEDSLDSSQIKIYQEIKEVLKLMNGLHKTYIEGILGLSIIEVAKKKINSVTITDLSSAQEIQGEINNNNEQSRTFSRDVLNQFVETFQEKGKPDLKFLENPPTKGFMVVQNSITSGDSFEKFIDILKEKGITEEVTSFMVSDFDHGEEDVMIASVKKNGGIYHLEMKAPKPINSELDKEDNAIYCLFQNPIDCFKFVQEVIPFNGSH